MHFFAQFFEVLSSWSYRILYPIRRNSRNLFALFAIASLVYASSYLYIANHGNVAQKAQAAGLNFANYIEPNIRHLDAYSYENGFDSPVSGITGDFAPSGGSVIATQTNSVITTETFSLSQVGSTDGGIFEGWRFFDTQLTNTTNLIATSSSVQVLDSMSTVLATFPLAATDSVQSFSLSGISSAITAVSLRYNLKHSTNSSFAGINYLKVSGNTSKLFNLSIEPANTVAYGAGHARAEFNASLSVKNSALQDTYIIIDMNRINGNLADTSQDGALFTDAKFAKLDDPNFYLAGSPVSFLYEADSTVSGVAADLSNLADIPASVIGKNDSYSNKQGFVSYKLNKLEAGFSTNFKIKFGSLPGIIDGSTLRGAVSIVYGDIPYGQDVTLLSNKTKLEAVSTGVVTWSNATILPSPNLYRGSDRVSNTSTNALLFTAYAETANGTSTDVNNTKVVIDFTGSDCIPSINAITYPYGGVNANGYKVLTPLPQPPSYFITHPLEIVLYRYYISNPSTGIQFTADFSTSIKTDGSGLPCVPTTSVATAPKIKSAIHYEYPGTTLPNSITRDKSLKIVNSAEIGNDILFERYGDEREDMNPNLRSEPYGFPAWTEYYIANGASKAIARGGEDILIVAHGSDIPLNTVPLRHVYDLEKVNANLTLTSLRDQQRATVTGYKSCSANPILPDNAAFPHGSGITPASASILLANGWYPVNGFTKFYNSPSLTDPNAMISATLNGNQCYVLTEFNNITENDLSRSLYTERVSSSLADGTSIYYDNTAHIKYSMDMNGVLLSFPGYGGYTFTKSNNVSKPEIIAGSLNPAPIQGGTIGSQLIIGNNNTASRHITGANYVINLYSARNYVDFSKLNKFTYDILNRSDNPSGLPLSGEILTKPNSNCLNALNSEDVNCMMILSIADQFQPQNGWGFNDIRDEGHNNYIASFVLQFFYPLRNDVPNGTPIYHNFEIRKASNNQLGADNSSTDTVDWPTSHYAVTFGNTVAQTTGASISGSSNSAAKPGTPIDIKFSTTNTGSVTNDGLILTANLPTIGKQIDSTVPASAFTPIYDKAYFALSNDTNTLVPTSQVSLLTQYSSDPSCSTNSSAARSNLTLTSTTKVGYNYETNLGAIASSVQCLYLQNNGGGGSNAKMNLNYQLQLLVTSIIPNNATLSQTIYSQGITGSSTVLGAPYTIGPIKTASNQMVTQVTNTNAPVAVNDNFATRSSTSLTLTAVQVLSNDSADNSFVTTNTLNQNLLNLTENTFAVSPRDKNVATSLGNTVSYNPNTKQFLYTPILGSFGTDTFQYNVVDSLGYVSNTATVTVKTDQLFVCDYDVTTATPNCNNVVCDQINGNGFADCSVSVPATDNIPSNGIPDPIFVCDYDALTQVPNCGLPACDYVSDNGVPSCSVPSPLTDNIIGNGIADRSYACDYNASTITPDCPVPETLSPVCDSILDNGIADCSSTRNALCAVDDYDCDGVSDSLEGSVANTDKNQDGIPDWKQGNVVTINGGPSNAEVTLVGSGKCMYISSPGFVTNITKIDPNYTYSNGFVGYTLFCNDPSLAAGSFVPATGTDTGTITAYWNIVDKGEKFVQRKYGPTIPGQNNSENYYDLAHTLTRSTLFSKPVIKTVMVLTDGQRGDSTVAGDSKIVDPIGLGVPVVIANPAIVRTGGDSGILVLVAVFVISILTGGLVLRKKHVKTKAF